MPDTTATDRSSPEGQVGTPPTRFVLKWPLHSPVVTFQMPADAVVIDVREQRNVPTLWTLSSNASVDVPRTFVGYGTGHPIFALDVNEVYVGSAHGIDGVLVFHIFERVPASDAGAHDATSEGARHE